MKLILPIANGFEDIELAAVVDILRRSNIQIDIVGINSSIIESRSKIKINADKRFNEIINPKEYDGIVLVGGPGYLTLSKSISLVNLIKTFTVQGKLVAAIDEAVSILATNGLLDEKKAVISPGMEKLLAYPRDQPVIVDNNIITSQAPGTSLQFAIAIVKKLKGDNVAQNLKKELILV